MVVLYCQDLSLIHEKLKHFCLVEVKRMSIILLQDNAIFYTSQTTRQKQMHFCIMDHSFPTFPIHQTYPLILHICIFLPKLIGTKIPVPQVFMMQ